MDKAQLKRIIEAALLAVDKPLAAAQLAKIAMEGRSKPDRDLLQRALAELQVEYEPRGVSIVEVASGYRMQIDKDLSPWISKLFEERPPRYSRALLETLSLIAYRQPLTRAEIEEVRGVAVSTNIIKTLLEREWVRVVGHKEVPGRPAMYATTKEFLDYFNLKRIDELPPLAELTDLEKIKLDPQMELALEQAQIDADMAGETTPDSPPAEVNVDDDMTVDGNSNGQGGVTLH